MYSILIKVLNNKYKYYLDRESGDQYVAANLESLQTELQDYILPNYTLAEIVVVKNCTLSVDCEVEEAVE